MSEYPMLFSPVKIAGLSLKNRIVMPPMASVMELGGDQSNAWYTARAKGGAGLIIREATCIYDLAKPEKCHRLTRMVDASHAQGVPVIQQLFTPGMSESGEAFATSAKQELRAATTQELDAIPTIFARAAVNCQAAGMDGVEPHGAHGYFLNQMFNPTINRREDCYGGDAKARMLLGLRIVEAIRKAVNDDFVIFYRHTAEADGYGIEDSIPFLQKLVDAGVNVLDISPSWRGNEHCEIAAPIRDALKVPVLAVGEMDNAALAEKALQSGRCDLCAVGRQLIADADWPNKVASGNDAEIITCTKCNAACYGNLAKGIPIGCVENPVSGNEYLQD
jgi:2,4-dienoyl-CoA reductase-like NADH-dependent reductase (Old Yellow Enzyme family)